jgi:hypothetical protein
MKGEIIREIFFSRGKKITKGSSAIAKRQRQTRFYIMNFDVT